MHMSTPGVSLILGLADARRSPRAGSKAANLSLLIEARFPVPRGFVVTADAYRCHLWASGARGLVSAAADPEVRRRLRSALISAPVPADVWAAIEHAYRRLALQTGETDPAVSVRASAIDDEAPDGAFPGVYESITNVRGPEELGQAVRAVWASLWSDEASARRTSSRAVGAEPAMAVIVQQMAPADWRGRAFTADPDTGDPRRVIVSCSKDPGPDSITPPPPVRCVVDLSRFSVRFASDGDEGPGRGAIERIVEQAIVAEELVGGRVELEWALEGDRLWALQVRALNALPPFFPMDTDMEDGVSLRRASDHPVSHFAASRLHSRARADVGVPTRARLVNGYVYTRQASRGAGTDGIRRARSAIEQWEAGEGRAIEAHARRVIALELGSMRRQELMERLADTTMNADRAVCRLERLRHDGAAAMESARALIQGSSAAPLFADLFGGIADPTVMRDARLQEMGDRFATAESSGRLDDGQWWRGFRREVEAFARDYGYCFRDAGDILDPASWKSWIEHDEPVLRMVSAMRRQNGRPSVVTLHCAARQDAQAAATQAAKAFRGAARRRFVDRLRLVRRWLKAVGEAEQTCALALTALRLVMAETGRRLEESGAIVHSDDIWYLSLEEIVAAGEEDAGDDLAALVGARKHLAWLQQRLAAPTHLPSCERDPAQPTRAGEVVLRGLGVSPGVAVGRARVADSIQDAAEIENGEILIVRASTPAWTPFLAVAGGLVSEENCECWNHTALMRDYGVPAVVDCGGVLSAVTQGRKLKVDGRGGIIEL